MKLKLFAIAALSLSVFASCGNKAAQETTEVVAEEVTEQPAAETTEFDAGGAVVFANNATVTHDATLPTIIDFNATWCGPCQRFAPIFEEVAKEYKGKAVFLSIDVDNSPIAAQQFEVNSIPQITILMPDGTYKSTVGFMEKAQFISFINSVIK